jgi:hypothetical protein
MGISLEKLKAQTEEWRATAWLNDPFELCGVKVKDLSLEKYFLLKEIESPFILGNQILPEDFGIFLWIVSEDFSTDPKEKEEFQKKIIGVKLVPAKNEIELWLQEQFAEADTTIDNEKPFQYAHFLAIQIDVFAKEYGWTIEYILGLSIKRIIQLNSVIQYRYAQQAGKDYYKMRAIESKSYEHFFANSKN